MKNEKEVEKQLLKLLEHIPKGKVTTYKILAEELNINNARFVGKMLHKNERPDMFPCHRVVRSDGSIAEGYAFGGRAAQIVLLKKEGVPFKASRVDISKALCILKHY
ncbi:hypothetical protein A3D06_00505 [Candidatus Roizmanbacteria bacterium RIFCSPHIGHO2_02_FULL_40_9]|uniref:Methylated-DNA-[protein]-cysteine S-methyltransferase DNA binding domain-containing protein n=2 Tax=Candidatus Roizmaniibacteriota TaxID=1752723 RepID=A0A1F7IPI0_9BACT|nr:MAG: hypothetical protein A3D06_00505 [Candidatus Roizmanbacteria bacterium RIFCSPHIGHO2_02_FULL_40_9]OGK45251.1 MAG: hypothetical protein A2957_01410 [Candidatus Roizmanbacteria bacterium RIFCSPLOWO2_01_FULL_38_11]